MPQPACNVSGTFLQWGYIAIENGTLLQFEETTKFDQSATDAVAATFNIKVQGFIRPDVDGQDNSVFFGAASSRDPSAAGQVNAVKANAWLPRQSLLLKINGTTILNVRPYLAPYAPGLHTDADNGPRCTGFSVDRVFGGNVMQATLSLQCTIVMCDGPMAALNNRWTVTETFDSDWRMTKTLSGVVRVGHVDAWTNALKRMVLPGLPDGFRVESMNFARSTTGLEMTYQVVMQQMFAAPPYPASDWKCTVREEIRQGGGVSDFFFNCMMTGFTGATKRQLFIAAMAAFLSRVSTRTYLEGPPDFFMLHAAVIDHLDSNRLDLSITAQRQWGNADDTTSASYIGRWLGLVWQTLGVLPPVDLSQTFDVVTDSRPDTGANPWTDRWYYPDPSSAGFSDTIPSIFYQRFNQNPCEGALWPTAEVVHSEQSPPDAVDPPSSEPPPRVSGSSYYGASTNNPNTDASYSKVNSVQSQSFFTNIELQSRYITTHGLIHHPFASRASTTDSTGIIRRVQQPHSKRVVYYKATRYGTDPSVPSVAANYTDEHGINYFLEETEYLPHPKRLTPDGLAYLHTIEMRFTYAMDRPINPNEAHQSGSLPWDTSQLADGRVNLTALSDEEIA